ncbi:hypothetical protein PR202_ga11050 [Eleusine coracana subsp. coracana]|uniref:Kinesin-like protein n=1 Tax=Eleusine coracana subsp. coracana TaxID=191504 RepID=A0AAV5C858_ELECO|nr:hypothetical protein PR202_ga11050 [Eleusine coracana subsp. coracana]
MATRSTRAGTLHHKENEPVGKRQRTAAAGRQPLVAASQPAVEEPIVFTGREDVDNLLTEKMKGKNKMDYKGKSEQMMEYIKRLRACIKWLLEREDSNLAEIGKLSADLETANTQHSEKVAQLQNALEESKEIYEELQKYNSSLQNTLKKLEAEKMDVLKSLGDEKEAKVAIESSRNEILEDLKKAKLEEKRLNDQVEMLQNTNKRLQDYNASLQQYNSNLQSDATKNSDTIAKLQKEKNTMVETMNGLKDHINSVKNQLDLTKVQILARSLQYVLSSEAVKQKNELLKEVDGLRSELQRVREDRDNKSADVDSLMSELGGYKELTGKSVAQLDTAMAKTTALEETISSQREMIKTLEIKLAAATEKLKMSDLTATEAMTEHEKQKKTLADLQLRLEEAEQQIMDGEKLRKKLHNTILELKGNIRVFCRVRPSLSNESGALTYPKGGENMGRGIELIHNGKTIFTILLFAYVFIEISQLVQSALDGYKVCIFAYGQTGSGKTYTMMGNPEVEEQKGMIPRSLEQIFQASQALNSQGWKYKMQASMLEIYNETIRDLLSTNRMATQDGGSSKYNIKHDANGNTHVSDLTVVDVTSINEVSSLLRRAAQSRSIGRTQMNEESSRSHCVFTLRISGVNEGTDQQVQGVLNLIDLAGSERLNKSGATGDRLKETQAINKSLSSLSDVIFSIAKKDEHVPFRNSKLTYLLQPCLGGDSKTLMFVNLSPESSSTGESLCSLRFAARVNSCEIGIPRRQTQMRNTQ